MKRIFLLLAAFGLFTASAQSITSVVVSANPVDCQSWTITVDGMKPMPQFYVQGDSYSVSGSTLTVNIDFNAPPIGNPMFAPYTHVITIPANGVPPGAYSLNVTTFNIPANQSAGNYNGSVTVGSCCPAAANFTVSDSSFCSVDTVYVTDQSAGTQNVEWWVNGVLDHTGPGDFSLTGLSGVIEIVQVAIDSACTDTVTQSIYVNPLQAMGFSSVQVGHQFTFTAGGSSAFTYEWDFGDGSTEVGALVSHTYSQDGNYNVCLTTTGAQGCSGDSCQSVTYSTVGLPDGKDELRIYPNPARDHITIEGSVDGPIRWYNELGQEIKVPLHNGSQEYLWIFDLADIPAGVYYLQWADRVQKLLVR